MKVDCVLEKAFMNIKDDITKSISVIIRQQVPL